MRLAQILSALACLAAAACATPPMAEHQASLANVQLLRRADVPPIALGEFGLAPDRPARMDRSVSIRASTIAAPGGSFSQYLRQTFETELRAAGKLDATASTAISAQLTESDVESNPPLGRGTLGARIIATREGATLFDRELVVTDEWESNFIGAVAIPLAMDRYTALYPALVTQLLSDAEFRAAIAPAEE